MDLQTIKQWLLQFPLWKPDMPLYVEFTDAQHICGGLFPLGVEEVGKSADVMGNISVSCRARFELRMILPGPDGSEENARWLLSLQQWVQDQSAAGLAPRFGDIHQNIRAEKARLTQLRKSDKGMYTVCFTAHYKNIYEVNE